ncbi:histone deacetylase family protein [Thalassococcus lentus]|uniref:Histone deacetylase family protein n=1 Tax=Thalassococcus lentus TaxID=1210524 RepID=A0ABT4XS96_9RHOB|nr:histone deacetylase family protein [Thalassococcus lentus]MDA7424811.1 histone deacetylase family protein [Thalassococcus lentus]
MKAFFDPRQKSHDPQHFMARGQRLPSPEAPKRADILLRGAQAAGCHVETPPDHGQAPISAIHSAEYLSFLQTIHARWRAMPGAGDEVIPNVHPANRTDSYPSSPIGLAGYHQADTACPISAETWHAAYWSAQTALSASEAALNDGVAYALCRPPGHHAFGDLAGGFCFLNNAAIAAEHLRCKGLRPAILDVDVHHGNGTQGIFYERSDVLTVSIHANPEAFYPFYWGHGSERGKGAGLGSNLNLPLALGTGNDGFIAALETALDRITCFAADVIVVALGLDAHESDPFQGLTVTTEGFGAIAAAIKAAGKPTVLVQEGGYVSDDLGANLTRFLDGYLGR